MKFRTLLFILPFILTVAQAQTKTNGYLSLEYARGQEESGLSGGTFQNPQFGLFFSGELSPKLDYNSEIRFRNESQIEIDQAYLRLKSSDSFSLKLGLYLVPFGKYNTSNRPHQTALIKPPLNIENLFPSSWRDIGVVIEGKFRSIFYSTYIGNGLAESMNLSSAQQFRDNNKDKSKGLRMGLNLGRGLEAAFSYYRGKYDEGNERELILEGIDLSWVSEGFSILSEYSRAELENPPDFAKGKAKGYFVQLSFDMGDVRPVGSYQWLKYEDIFHGQDFVSSGIGGAGIFEERSRWTIGMVYFASPNAVFKVEYEFNREKEIEVKDNIFLLQVALNF